MNCESIKISVPSKIRELLNDYGFVEIWENASINVPDLEQKQFFISIFTVTCDVLGA